MQDGLFFRVLRRFNILIGTVLGLALIAGCGYVGWNIVKLGHPWPIEYASVPLQADTVKAVSYDVSLTSAETPREPSLSSYYLFALNRTAPPAQGEYYHALEVANLMDIDEKTGEGFWLFKGKNRNIVMRDPVRQGDLAEGAVVDSRPFMGLVMLVVEQDTNKDGQLTASDGTSVYYWKQGTTQAVKLLGAEQSVGGGQMNGKRYSVLYKKGGKTISVLYSLPDFRLISEKTLPDVPN
jgi:hypothetical protein